MNEICANCDRRIGNLETANTFQDQVVCNECYERLSRANTVPGQPADQGNLPPVANYYAPASPYRGKDKTVAALLAIFMGGLGIHKFYLGNWGWGILCILFCWTGVPSLLAFIEALFLLTMRPEAFDEKYNLRTVAPFDF